MDKGYFDKKDYNGNNLLESTKSYVHFDKRTSLNSCWDYITNPDNIAVHSFLPFIKYEQIFNRYVVKDEYKRYKENIKTENALNGKEKRCVKQKVREICYASHIDSCIYTYYAAILNEKYNARLLADGIDYKVNNSLHSSVIAYRTNLEGKSNIEFAYEAFKAIRNIKQCMLIIGDFKSFFDTLDHLYLKEQIKKILEVNNLSKDWYAVFKSITKYSYVDLGQLIFRNCKKCVYCFKHKYVDKKNERLKQAGKQTEDFQCKCKCGCVAKLVNESYGNIQEFASVSKKEIDGELIYNEGKCLNRFCQKAFNSKKNLDINFARKNKLIKIPQRKNAQGEIEKMGIPQGSAISAVFANVYMYEFDKNLKTYIDSIGGLYMRYSDDFMVILPKDGEFVKHLEYLKSLVNKAKVTLEDKKTQVFDIDIEDSIPVKSCSSKYLQGVYDGKNSIDYLGFNFDGKKVTIKMKVIYKYYYRMYSKIKYIRLARKQNGKDCVGTHNLYKNYSSKIFRWKEEKSNSKKPLTNFLSYVKHAQKVFYEDKDISLPFKHHLDKIKSRLNSKQDEKGV